LIENALFTYHFTHFLLDKSADFLHDKGAQLLLHFLSCKLLHKSAFEFQIKFAIFRDSGVKLSQVFSLPKTNYCTLLRNSKNIPFIRDFFDQVSKFGNIPLSCPIRRNNYYLDNFSLAGMTELPDGFDRGKYQVHFRLLDENKPIPRLAVRMNCFIRIE
jgi:Protein of unknown function (DUF1091)